MSDVVVVVELVERVVHRAVCSVAVRACRGVAVLGVRVVRGGKRLLNNRHHLDAAGLTEEQWRAR